MDELKPEFAPTGKKAVPIQCISLAWSADGATLFAGCQWTINTASDDGAVELPLCWLLILSSPLLCSLLFRAFSDTDNVVRVFTVTPA